MASGLLDGLNPQQLEAVTAGEGPVLVLAGPGSGKTRVLTHRIAYLIEEMGVHPAAIMAVTFTNKAANEMKERVERLLGGRLHGLQIGTFHAICARLLRREAQHTDLRTDYLIYDTDDQVTVVTQALNEMNLDTKRYRPRQMLGYISQAKNELLEPANYRGQGYLGEITGRVYTRYQEILVGSNARDFDDLLMDTAALFRDHPEVLERYQHHIAYLLVDEFQDTNAAQYMLVRQIGGARGNVFVVGDEDQAIYGFRGADYRNVLQFRRDFPQARIILLEQNYRSTQVVLDAARAVIDRNTQRTPKALFTDQQGGVPVTLYEAFSDTEEAEFVLQSILDLRRRQDLDYRDFAIMYRTNAQSRALEDAFKNNHVPYRLVGGVSFYERREVRDLLAYLRLVHNPDDTVSFRRVINVPKRGIGKKSLDDFFSWAARKRLGISGALEALADGEISPLGVSAVRRIIEFRDLLVDWRNIAASGDLVGMMDDLMARIGYSGYIRDISTTPDEAAERDQNVKELRGILMKHLQESNEPTLSAFLENIALVSETDNRGDDINRVTLLTLHAAKGLEYPVVFITGVEEGLMPHLRSFDDPESLAEERRLMYVGLTRAMQRVYLTYAFRRVMYGESAPGTPSRFLADIPAELLEGGSTRLLQQREQKRYLEDTSWERPMIFIQKAQPERQNRPRLEAPAPKKADGLKYRSGQRVRHAKFGEGMVVESKRMGADEEVTVSFKAHGIKKLAASFANLTMVED